MKAASLAAILALTLAATGVAAQTTAAQTPAAATPAAATSEPQILNAPKPAERPVEPYAGQKPAGSPPTAAAPAPATSTPAPAAAASPPAAAASPATTAPAAEGAATAAKAAASEAKAAAPVSEGPAVQPIGKTGVPASTAAKSDTKPDAKVEAVPTLAKPPPPKPTLHVAIDLTNQKMTVSENGGQQLKWNISSGRTGYLTPKGTFRPVWMSKMWYSRKYDYAPMPHAIFFHGGAAIHGTDSVYALGRPASHGCVRLSPSNAAALYRLVTKHGKQKTEITVFGTPKQSGPVASNEDGTSRPRTTTRSYENEPWWNDDDDDMPPVPRRGVYSERGYDDGYDRPRYRSPPPRQRRYVRDYDSYGSDF